MHFRQASFPGKGLDTSLKDYHRKIVKKQSSSIDFDCVCSAVFPSSFQDWFSEDESVEDYEIGCKCPKAAP